MSTLVVSNINDGTTTVPATYVTNGSAKAWVNFNGTSTVSIRNSLNTSSMTDLGTGRYGQNFTTSFGAADFSSSVSGSGTNAFPDTGDANQNTRTQNVTASLLQMIIAYNTGSIVYDPPYMTYTSHGDLA